MATILEAVHRPAQAVVVLQDVLKPPRDQRNGHKPGSGHVSEVAAVQLSQAERRKFESMLTAAQTAVKRHKTPDHYKVLGVTCIATEDDIKK